MENQYNIAKAQQYMYDKIEHLEITAKCITGGEWVNDKITLPYRAEYTTDIGKIPLRLEVTYNRLTGDIIIIIKAHDWIRTEYTIIKEIRLNDGQTN